MAAFDRVQSGIPQMDKALDNIRLGDNVVFRVSRLEEFKLFVIPYVEQAKKDRRNIIYFRFAGHEPLVEDCPEVKKVEIPLSHRFETFTIDIHNRISDEGKDAFYIFDCLSELQTAWATDLMMGNFFKVTCPFLFILDTVAYFPVLRGKHSVYAINKIKNTTQLFIDVYTDKNNIYVRPEKVWNRSGDSMFLPHIYEPETGSFTPILDGVKTSRFYQMLENTRKLEKERHSDYWDRFFNQARTLYSAGQEIDAYCDRMCNIMMTRDERMRVMVKEHFSADDYFGIREHMIGTGMIGGKACGMLLARAIARSRLPEVCENLEPHDSFYVGSDVYYTYIVDNDFWDLRISQRTPEGYFSLADEFARKLKNGVFNDEMEEALRGIIEYYGQDPYIVRSSSILEDGFGNAFAGKYESVFCANRGDADERLLELENAIRSVYASTMNLSALDYRKRRGLEKRDEQMALLIQRVSGSYYGDKFMPCAAGVGYSYSPYKFIRDIDQASGMLRLVMGLGTSAVDRTEGSYPRLVSLDAPERTVYTTVADRHRYSQRKIEVVDTGLRKLSRLGVKEIQGILPRYLKNAMLEHDYEVEDRLRQQGRDEEVLFVSCKGLLKRKPPVDDLRKLMQCIQEEYGCPVDIEFTVNLSDNDEYMINLLQCRPLQVYEDAKDVEMPDGSDGHRIVLESYRASMGLSRRMRLDLIVYVDPKAYYTMPYYEKNKAAQLISRINWETRGKEKHMLLMVPGRIGTSSPELGVPVTFSDISEFEAVCEIEEKEIGYNPELSYGSHIFQDLVEQEILYTAVFADGEKTRYDPSLLTGCRDITDAFDCEEGLRGIVYVYDVSEKVCELCYDLKNEHFMLLLDD